MPRIQGPYSPAAVAAVVVAAVVAAAVVAAAAVAAAIAAAKVGLLEELEIWDPPVHHLGVHTHCQSDGGMVLVGV